MATLATMPALELSASVLVLGQTFRPASNTYGGLEESGGDCFHVSLLDPTFFIDLFRRDTGALRVWESIRTGQASGSYSAITAFELWLGRPSQDEDDFYTGLMQLLDEAALTAAAGRRAAEMLRGLPASMSERLIRDALVAASAAERGETVITRDVRDFNRLSVAVEGY
jgi:predicted nucleic acid-binding protein